MSEIQSYLGDTFASSEGPADDLRDQLPARVWQRFLKQGLFGLGEDYVMGLWHHPRLDVALYQIMQSYRAFHSKWNAKLLLHLLRSIIFNPQIGRGVFVVGEKHYDLGNDLFSAMLDRSMSYTCGLWSEGFTLEQAQERKLRVLCEKLHLRPGMQVLDIGCGWGNFAYFAAKNYGAKVIGLTISKQQYQFAAAHCRELPVEIRLQDYRDFRGTVDRVVSIEMIEAVGRKNLGSYFASVRQALKRDGLFALQVISGESFTRGSNVLLDQYLLWLVRHIFPNGYLPRLDQMSPRQTGLSMQSLEAFGADYDKTLQAWRDNFERAWPELSSNYDERFKRIWEFYLAGCMAGFRSGLVDLFQIVYKKID